MPGWRDYYLSHDQTPHYEYGKTVLRIILAGRRAALGAQVPAALRAAARAAAVYPDALVVFTHRDPVASLQSIVTQLAYVIRTREKQVDPDWYMDYWTDRVERLLRPTCATSATCPPSSSSTLPSTHP